MYRCSSSRHQSKTKTMPVIPIDQMNLIQSLVSQTGSEMSEVENQPASSESQIVTERPSESLIWKHEAVMLLINMYGEHKNLFDSAVCNKKDVWKKISIKMQEKGYNIDASECDKKFRSLKHRHKIISERETYGRNVRTSWQYFNAMDQIVGGDRSWKVQKESPSGSKGFRPILPWYGRRKTETESDDSDDDDSPSAKKRKTDEPPKWFKAYAEETNRRMDTLIATNTKMIKVAEDRNKILKRLVESMIKH